MRNKPLKHLFICLFPNCDYSVTCSNAFSYHLTKKHSIKREEYAFRFNTEEISTCYICDKKFFATRTAALLRRSVKCCSKKCAVKLAAKTMKDNGTSKEIGRKLHEWCKTNPEKKLAAVNKAAKKMIEEGTYVENGKKKRKWCEENPEKVKEQAQRTAYTMKKNGTYVENGKKTIQFYKDHPEVRKFIGVKNKQRRIEEPEKYKEAIQKGRKTKLEKGIDSLTARKAANTMIADGTYKLTGEKGVLTKRKNGYYESDSFKKNKEAFFAGAKRYREKNPEIFEHCPSYSLVSQELFIALKEKLIKKGVECFYATNIKEWRVNTKKCFRYLDFYVPTLNKCIEFDEEYHETEKQKLYDVIRENEIFEAVDNIQIKRIKIKDFLDDKQKTITECINFIFDESFYKTVKCLEKIICS